MDIFPLRAAIRHALFSGEGYVQVQRDELREILKEYERMGRRYNSMQRDWVEARCYEQKAAAKKAKKAKRRARQVEPSRHEDGHRGK